MGTRLQPDTAQRYSGVVASLELINGVVLNSVIWDEATRSHTGPVYALGWTGEGRASSPLASPRFYTLAELNTFCLDHLDHYARIAERAEHGVIMPVARFWDMGAHA